MNIQSELDDFKKRFDVEFAAYFDRSIVEAMKRDPFVADALRYVRRLALSGGKRLRAACMYHAYLGAGGTDIERILRTTLSVELIHLFLLIHDDIIDRDDLRHGIPSAHAYFRTIGEQMNRETDGVHFGDSMAIIVGDMVGAMGNQVIFDSGFDPNLVLRALSVLQDVVSLTVVGQSKDILIEYRGEATEDEILAMYEHKTARYTMDGPLRLGALLAGAPESLGEALSRYAIPIGIAFQIQDDILGVFGDEHRLGKPVGSDIAEGKMTLLVSRTLAVASPEECAEFRAILKKGDSLIESDIRRFRELIISTGALDATRALAEESIRIGMKALDDIRMTSSSLVFLKEVAAYMMKRNR